MSFLTEGADSQVLLTAFQAGTLPSFDRTPDSLGGLQTVPGGVALAASSESQGRDILVQLDSATSSFGSSGSAQHLFFRWAQPVLLLAVPIVGAEFEILNLLCRVQKKKIRFKCVNISSLPLFQSSVG